MSAAQRQAAALAGFAVLGAPGAWAVQHVTGFALTQAACNKASWGVPLDALIIAVSSAAALVTVAASAAAVLALQATRGAGSAPPGGRIHFLAVIGVATAPLFLVMIVMSGLGSVLLEGCRQG